MNQNLKKTLTNWAKGNCQAVSFPNWSIYLLLVNYLFVDPTIAAVFASLKDESINSSSLSQVEVESKVNIDHVIMNAKTVNGLLSITENNNTITRKHALKVMSDELTKPLLIVM